MKAVDSKLLDPCSRSSLDRSFIYQEVSTGGPSSSTLTVRQLVRILCPAVPLPQRVTPDTNLLEIISQNQKTSEELVGADESNPGASGSDSPTALTGSSPAYSYASTWRPARTLPVLREAVATWYYQDTATAGAVQGPVPCRALAGMDPSTVRVYCCVPAPTSDATDQQSSESDWKFIEELPDLMSAIECFELPKYEQVAGTDQATADLRDPRVHDELEAFLASTDTPKEDPDQAEGGEDANEEAYESDGGTRYIRDRRTGSWIHEALVASKPPNDTSREGGDNLSNNKRSLNQIGTLTKPNSDKSTKKKFSAKNARCWIYMSGLPPDTTPAEVASFCSKAGLLDLDPETQKPKIKLYKDKKTGVNKGDASVCFVRPESVDLALMLLDEAPFRPQVIASATSTNMDSDVSARGYVVHVERAKFQQHGKVYEGTSAPSHAKRKVAKLATLQAMDWDEGEINGRLTGGRKGLRIIVLKHLFQPSHIDPDTEDIYFGELEQEIRKECETFGVVEKITAFAKNPAGVVIVKFTLPSAAGDAVKHFDGRLWPQSKQTVEASFWDGVTDYTIRDDAKEEQESAMRQEEFGQWIETQELPPELQLQHEG